MHNKRQEPRPRTGSEQALAPCRRAGILRRRGLPQSPEKSDVIESFTATSNHH